VLNAFFSVFSDPEIILILWQVGCIAGLTLNSMLAERLGYKITLIGSLVLTCVFICLTFFAENIATIEAGAVLIGIPWFVYSYSNFPVYAKLREKIGVYSRLFLSPILRKSFLSLCVDI